MTFGYLKKSLHLIKTAQFDWKHSRFEFFLQKTQTSNRFFYGSFFKQA